jgi:hypothetical protein
VTTPRRMREAGDYRRLSEAVRLNHPEISEEAFPRGSNLASRSWRHDDPQIADINQYFDGIREDDGLGDDD